MQQVVVAAPSSPNNMPTSGAHPNKEGFRKAYYVQNRNQTTAAGANQDMSTMYFIEGQDLVGSGWDYTDPNSYLTISFWVKTSVAQTYYVGFRLYALVMLIKENIVLILHLLHSHGLKLLTQYPDMHQTH